MNRSVKFLVLTACAFGLSVSHATDDKKYPWQQDPSGTGARPGENAVKPTLENTPVSCSEALGDPTYRLLAQHLSQLPSNREVVRQLSEMGLSITNVSWQDTGRYHGSSGGNNISDVRLAAITRDRAGKIDPIVQPIIRLPNFEDKTVDIDMDKVLIPVGNAWGAKKLSAVSLKELLTDLPTFLSHSERMQDSLFAPERDKQVLVSAQAVLMPVPKGGEAHFVPSIFNYQSTKDHPAVLVILVSNRGTSVTVIDNTRDPLTGVGGNGQMLFHNKDGEKAPFTLQSLKEVTDTAAGRKKVEALEGSGQAIAGQSGVNQVMMIQVPLKHPDLYRGFAFSLSLGGLESAADNVTRGGKSRSPRGLDTGVVDVANYTLGKFIELDGKGPKLERDLNVPIRVDVVRYMATDTTELTAKELADLPEQLRGIYEAGQNLGSLVVGDDYQRLTRNY